MIRFEKTRGYYPDELREMGLEYITSWGLYNIIYGKGKDRYLFHMTQEQLFYKQYYKNKENRK